MQKSFEISRFILFEIVFFSDEKKTTRAYLTYLHLHYKLCSEYEQRCFRKSERL